MINSNDKDNIIFYKEFDKALMGISENTIELRAVYNKNRCIEILQQTNNWSYEESEDYFSYNYLIESEPIFITLKEHS